jgi:hypothetical protein
MGDNRGNYSWQILRASMNRWSTVALVSLGVFIGSLYAAFLVERWAYPRDFVGDRFIPVAILLGIVSWYLTARWTRGPVNQSLDSRTNRNLSSTI